MEKPLDTTLTLKVGEEATLGGLHIKYESFTKDQVGMAKVFVEIAAWGAFEEDEDFDSKESDFFFSEKGQIEKFNKHRITLEKLDPKGKTITIKIEQFKKAKKLIAEKMAILLALAHVKKHMKDMTLDTTDAVVETEFVNGIWHISLNVYSKKEDNGIVLVIAVDARTGEVEVEDAGL